MDVDTETHSAAADAAADMDALKSTARELVAAAADHSGENNHLLNGGSGGENGDEKVADVMNGNGGEHETDGAEEGDTMTLESGQNGEQQHSSGAAVDSGGVSEAQNGAVNHDSDVNKKDAEQAEDKSVKEEEVKMETDIKEEENKSDEKVRQRFVGL
jgi:hypothetical protein